VARIRIDDLLVERGIVEDRHKASALVMAGRVLIGSQRIDKPGVAVDAACDLRIKSDEHPYASRAGVKLEHALTHFQISVQDCCCLDIGSSTGGFVDCLLQRGARKVYAVDVGTGLLDWRLQTDARVVSLNGANARHLQTSQIPERVDWITADVSFISLRAVLPSLAAFRAETLALVKPQFELPPGHVPAGGVVTDQEARQQAVNSVSAAAAEAGFHIAGTFDSPLAGAEGNVETFVWLRWP
jgi:23S rRNA (cytidine1920-2'-O)/16S rRNA (cytidine1409-2'-O)-methyltransferase